MKKKLFITCSLLILAVLIGHSQEIKRYRNFKSMDYHKYMMKQNRTYLKNIEKAENIIYAEAQSVTDQSYTLPIVFHIVYQEGQTIPSDKELKEQITMVNKNFRKTDYKSKHEADVKEKFGEKAADIEIEFCLASVNPQGAESNGTTQVKTSKEIWGMTNDMKSKSTLGQDAWDINKYINVWVVNMEDSVSGFAQLPGGPAESDGIVIDKRYLMQDDQKNKEYKQGKTLTHLLGNYLGLYDLWGPCLCCDDNVEDTPIHNGPNYGNIDLYKHVSLCDGNPVEMTMNFMDNTNDDWMYMFTQGQKKRMQAVLSSRGPRAGIGKAPYSCKENKVSVRSREEYTLSVFPNPAYDKIQVIITSPRGEAASVHIYNTLGVEIMKREIVIGEGENTNTMDVSQLATGSYLIQVATKSWSTNQKFIINK
jgi:hypothetical protein